MKKKTIEKIPYLGLQKISRKKSAKYIGVTAIKIIGHKKHLLLEVYENKKESKKIPVVRITLTKKDFGTYWPDKNIWTRQQVSYYRPIWMETYTGGILTDENILQSPEDLERIKNFCGTKLFDASWWWEHISRYEADITSTERINRVERERKRRQEALKDRQANTKALPEKAILYRADHAYFHDEHFLYYKKHGSRADIACSKCGGVTTARWKSSGAYEDQFERNIEEPRENSFGTCPMCGARGQYKCKGKVKGSIRKTRYLFLGQKYKDNGFVMRYIQVEKEWTLGFIAGENGNEMYNAYEKLSGVELARAYFEPGKKVQVDYNKHDPYVGKDFWDDCNLYGLSSIRINSGPILPETYDEMTGTMFQYSAMKEYTNSLMSVCNPVEYLECYMRTPQLTELEWDCVNDRILSVSLGDYQFDYISNQVSINNRIESAIREDGSVIGSQVQGILDAVKTQFHALRDVAQKQDVRAMLFEDLNPDSPTFGAMCLGSMGFEIASKRTADGKDWIWSTFGTGKGFFADYIIAGTMLADRIYGGTLTIGGIDNIAGIIKVLDGNGAILTIMDKDGILTNGKYTCGSDEFGRRVEISEGEMKIMDKSGNTVGRIFAVSNEIFKIGTENALFRMFKTGEVYVDCQSFGVNGYNGFTGTVEYSDGTYENYVGGLLIGGKSKEGAYP